MTTFHRLKCVAACMAIGALAVGSMGAQASSSKGKIAVVVIDSSDAPLEGIDVKVEASPMGAKAEEGPPAAAVPGGGIKGKSSGRHDAIGLLNPSGGRLVASAKSDKDGKIEFADIAPGKYRVSVSDSDGNIVAFAAVRVAAGKTVNAKLKLPAK